MATRSSLQGILENLRDAAVDFAKPYQTPANIPAALADLLMQLGIADPGAAVKAQLDNAAKNWGNLGDQLSGLNLDFTDPARALEQITNKAKAVKQSIDAILSTPNAIWDGMGAAGAAIKSVFPIRLLDYILYEALTKSNPKIGGAFLLFGVLRREFTPAPSAAFVPANIRIFDLEQLIKVVTHPREAILEALKWGTDDFNGRPIVDGMVLLSSLIPPATPASKGPEEDEFALADEKIFVGRDLAGLRPSARRTLSVSGMTLSFVGLHRTGVGVLIKNPVNLSGGVGSLNLPTLPPGQIFALSPGPDRLKDPPIVKRLP